MVLEVRSNVERMPDIIGIGFQIFVWARSKGRNAVCRFPSVLVFNVSLILVA